MDGIRYPVDEYMSLSSLLMTSSDDNDYMDMSGNPLVASSDDSEYMDMSGNPLMTSSDDSESLQQLNSGSYTLDTSSITSLHSSVSSTPPAFSTKYSLTKEQEDEDDCYVAMSLDTLDESELYHA